VIARYRQHLPQRDHRLFLTDGGIETTLIFHDGLDLPDFAAFHLLRTVDGEAALLRYFRSYAELARRYETGLVLESATWRASADWGTRLGYSRPDLVDANRRSIELLEGIRREYQSRATPVVISGCLGPRGDGYTPDHVMSVEEAEDYHGGQIETFASTAADLVTAITMNNAEEATGLVRAARRVGMPVVVSFTVETDGNLPTGQRLQAAIEQVDAATSDYPAYFMINCAHPTHFEQVLSGDGAWQNRIRGLRANASTKSHAELNESTTLDIGNPVELGRHYASLMTRLPHLTVMGGCCGTDHRHVEEMARSCAPLF